MSANSKGIYAVGKKYCGKCQIWRDFKFTRCPECNQMLRIKPRHVKVGTTNKTKEKLGYVKSR